MCRHCFRRFPAQYQFSPHAADGRLPLKSGKFVASLRRAQGAIATKMMMNRSTTGFVTFRHSFTIEGLDGWQPAGTYVIEMEEELLQGLSFPAWRRVHTAIRLPQRAGTSVMEQVATIDPKALDTALAVDRAADSYQPWGA